MSYSVARLMMLAALIAVGNAASNAQQAQRSADKTTDRAKQDVKAASRPVPVKLTEAQEDSALQFARRHHPELAVILERLRKDSATGFKRGIREVHLSVLRLQKVKERFPARFDSELTKWKTYSEIRLLIARWVMSQDPDLEKKIRGLLRSRQESRLAELQADRDRLAERLKQLDEELRKEKSGLEEQLANEWDRLTRQASSVARSRKRNDAQPPKTRKDVSDKKTKSR